MAEEKTDSQAEEDKTTAPAPKSKKNLYLIIGIVVLALAGGVIAWKLLAGGKGGAHESQQEDKEKHQEAKSSLIALDSFILNLAEQGRFLKITMQFELVDTASQQLVNDKMPQLRDAIITLMSSKSIESVSSPEGKLQLKDELLLRANQTMGKDLFKNLYFTEFVMQ